MNPKLILTAMAMIAVTTVVLFSVANSQPKVNSDIELISQFLMFKSKFGKQYQSESDFNYRQSIFAETLKRISAHNSDESQTFKMGVNMFSDLTSTERKSKYLGKSSSSPKVDHCQAPDYLTKSKSNPTQEAVDWAAAGKVQVVKDQQQCGSCWAFSAIAALESAYAIYKNDLPNLSEQELVDCSNKYGNQGCNGGDMFQAYNYILDHKINTSAKYPYKGADKKCKKDLVDHGDYTMSQCVKTENTIDGLVKATVIQPVAVGFYVIDSFFDYQSGVYNPTEDCDSLPNHGVLNVGFDLSGDLPFFKVKNSWGSSWGEEGYFRVITGKGKGTCQIAGNGGNYYPLV
jgi:KDEL-tailed cysteine endopeptidase